MKKSTFVDIKELHKRSSFLNYGADIDYLSFDPTKHKSCKNCKILPLCMGGCPRHRMASGRLYCYILKSTLKERILFFASEKMNAN